MKNNIVTRSAQRYLSRTDPIMGVLVSMFRNIERPQRPANFSSFVRIIINQQLSSKAAETIFSRVETACNSSPILLDDILNCGQQKLRNCGMSKSKAKFVIDLAEQFKLEPNFIESLQSLPSEGAYKKLIEINGIGSWSANIFLIFYLGNKDVFPYGDSSLGKALLNLYGVNINRRRLDQVATVENWSPYRSVAALYLWEWIDSGMPKLPISTN
jgi:DNA-3-methyladenine glycosylase II